MARSYATPGFAGIIGHAGNLGRARAAEISVKASASFRSPMPVHFVADVAFF
jgi:hypothetical protein